MALEFKYKLRDFSDKENGEYLMETSWNELMWAMVTVGKFNNTCRLIGSIPAWGEIIFKAALVLAALDVNAHNQLIKTRTYSSLDPSEKNVLSYYLGMMMIKLISSRLWRIYHLVHFDFVDWDVVKNYDTHTGEKSRKKPDLIGYNNIGSTYTIFEAKGRSDDKINEALHKGKEQTRVIDIINGQNPVSSILFYKLWLFKSRCL